GRAILLFCMFLGASAGSTGGGVKALRLLLLLKHAHRELKRLVHPHAVIAVKLGGRPVPNEGRNTGWGFLGLEVALFFCGFLALAALGLDLVTSFSAVAATIGNIGPGLGLIGPTDNYAAIPLVGKWVLILCMLLGRLEIYTVIILLVPEFWRK
ncbi:MAG: TrkH family potassium uptake protein, partial [Deltaproteobacteria bacterium]|nr:TrkH family potassium uptake protein [Deltaproteobacteria bacterium]